MFPLRNFGGLLLVLLFFYFGAVHEPSTQAQAQGRPTEFTVPELSAPVEDFASLLRPSVKRALNQALFDLQASTGIQIGVLVVENLSGLTIEEAAIKVADKWKLGTAQKDNGVILLVSKTDRRVRIEVGQGLEGDLPDAYARRIIDNDVLPAFKAGDYDRGILNAVIGIVARVAPQFDFNGALRGVGGGQESPNRSSAPRVSQAPPCSEGLIQCAFSWIRAFLKLVFIIGFLIVFLFFQFFSSRSRYHSTSWYGGGGGWGGGGGGGGSWGGGGGGFSGGGSSGQW